MRIKHSATLYHMRRTLIDSEVLKQTHKRGNIIYGGQAVKAHIGKIPYLSSIEPSDWDIASDNPKRDAEEMKRILNKKIGNKFYVLHKRKSPKRHDDVWSVKNRDITPGFRYDYPPESTRTGMPLTIHTFTSRNPSILLEKRFDITAEQQEQFRDLTEIDYTKKKGDHFDVVSLYDRTTNEPIKVCVVSEKDIIKRRRQTLAEPDKKHRYHKDERTIRNLQKAKKIKRDFRRK